MVLRLTFARTVLLASARGEAILAIRCQNAAVCQGKEKSIGGQIESVYDPLHGHSHRSEFSA